MCRAHTRRKFIDAATVPYPAGKPPLLDDEATVIIDPSEMRLTAEAMMFVDSNVVVLARTETR